MMSYKNESKQLKSQLANLNQVAYTNKEYKLVNESIATLDVIKL